MEDQEHDTNSGSPRSSQIEQRNSSSEPVRSRWTPKPEQILILESIFNSGMVNPPKDETVRIRKLLEKFGSVGDANVFYWFQNRRSRSRRRQRQIQASLSAAGDHQLAQPRGGGGAIQYDNQSVSMGGGYAHHVPNDCNSFSSYGMMNSSGSGLVGSGSSSTSSSGLQDGGACDEYFGFSTGHTGLQELDQGSMFGQSDASSLHYQSGVITVFINGVATEVGRGPVDMKAMFGAGDYVLFHSSGVPLQVNEYGFLVQSLQHGESYFLVPRHS